MCCHGCGKCNVVEGKNSWFKFFDDFALHYCVCVIHFIVYKSENILSILLSLNDASYDDKAREGGDKKTLLPDRTAVFHSSKLYIKTVENNN